MRNSSWSHHYGVVIAIPLHPKGDRRDLSSPAADDILVQVQKILFCDFLRYIHCKNERTVYSNSALGVSPRWPYGSPYQPC